MILIIFQMLGQKHAVKVTAWVIITDKIKVYVYLLEKITLIRHKCCWK